MKNEAKELVKIAKSLMGASYSSWERQTLRLFKKTYGLDKNDVFDRSRFKDAFEGGDSPKEYVEWHGNKYDLDEI